MLGNRARELNKLMVSNMFVPIGESYEMTINDLVVAATVSDAVITVTLPNVLEAAGRTFLIKAINAGLVYYVKIQDNDESKQWADINLTAPSQFVLLKSTGESWEIIAGKYLGADTSKDPYRIVETFKSRPVAAGVSGSAATGATGNTNVMMLNGGNVLEYHIKGTQTILCPQLTASGLDIGMDQTDNDGVEVSVGYLTPCSKGRFVVGTTPAFFMKVKFKIGTVAGTDDLVVGFRKAEAFQANVDDYDEMAGFNVNAGNIYTSTILNNAATTDTDTTDNWADGETHTLEVRVSAAGVVTFLIDDAAPTVTQAFTFDTAEVVIPFIFLLQANAAQTGEVNLIHFECGLQ